MDNVSKAERFLIREIERLEKELAETRELLKAVQTGKSDTLTVT